MTLKHDRLVDWKLTIENETIKPSQVIKKYETIIKRVIEELNHVSIYITSVLIVNGKPFNFISPPVDNIEKIVDGCTSLENNIYEVTNLNFHFVCESSDYIGERYHIVEAF